jgi:nicotinic acid phosphoribosyltransferase
LAGLGFSGDVWAVPKGRVVLAGEPLLEVTAPIAEAQLVETALLNEVTFQTAVASKAARCRLAAFRAFAGEFPDRATFLVDTYDTLGGVRAAIEVIGELGLRERLGIRIDSGDLAELAVAARQLLDQAGLEQVRIFASGGLDEQAIADLVARRVPIDAYGVGTKVGSRPTPRIWIPPTSWSPRAGGR